MISLETFQKIFGLTMGIFFLILGFCNYGWHPKAMMSEKNARTFYLVGGAGLVVSSLLMFYYS